MAGKKIGLEISTLWNLDAFIEEGEIMIEVCKRIRDHKHHNKRCCMNCKSLGTIRTLRCDVCDKKSVFTIKAGDPIDRVYTCEKLPLAIPTTGKPHSCGGTLKNTHFPNRQLCLNAKVAELMEYQIEFDIEGDTRIFICPFFKFSDSVTNNVKYDDLKKCLK